MNSPPNNQLTCGDTFLCKQSKKGGKDQETIQSSTWPTQDTTWESNKNTIKNHQQEPRGQPFPSRLPQGSDEPMNRRNECMTNTTHKNTDDLQKKYCLGTVSKNILLEGLNRFHSASLALSSDVD